MIIKKTTKKLILLLILLFIINNNNLSQTKNININKEINTFGGVTNQNEIKHELLVLNRENTSFISSINSKLGKPYKWGAIGPNSYDCSGFVWKVFNENKYVFTRSTAKEYYRKFKPVSNTDRFTTGTLVFFNNLKHVGIVLDKNGFYHASRSRGITYSKFNKYWISRIVGFRKVN